MASFKDKNGDAWRIDLPIGTVDRVKSDSNGRFDLWDPRSQINGRTLTEVLWDDLPTFWELLWWLVRPQAESQGIDPEAFGGAMASECLIEAQVVFHREWASFFRGLRKPDQALALEKMAAYRETMARLIETRLDDLKASDLDGRVARKIRATLDNSLLGLQESLESILGDSPGGT